MNQCRSKNCPRCGKAFDVPLADLEWEPGREGEYTPRLEKLFTYVHCDACVLELDTDLRKGEQYRKQRAAKEHSYQQGWILADTKSHTFTKSVREFEQRTSDIENAFEWGKHWTPKQQKNSAFIEGTKGAGKSYFCHCVLNAAMGFGLTAREVTAMTIQDLAMDFEKRRAAQWNLGQIKRVGCLLIEEMGLVIWTEHAVLALREIIDYRYRHHMPTLITSNLSKEEQWMAWGRKCSNQSIVGPMVDRMQNFVGLKFEAQSLRGKVA